MAARKAVGDDGTKQAVIETQHGRGYRFVAPLTTAPPVVSSQHAVASSQPEERQMANDLSSLEVSVQSLAPDGQEAESKTVVNAPPNDQPLAPSLSDARPE